VEILACISQGCMRVKEDVGSRVQAGQQWAQQVLNSLAALPAFPSLALLSLWLPVWQWVSAGGSSCHIASGTPTLYTLYPLECETLSHDSPRGANSSLPASVFIRTRGTEAWSNHMPCPQSTVGCDQNPGALWSLAHSLPSVHFQVPPSPHLTA
jgi:hypothetical protein